MRTRDRGQRRSGSPAVPLARRPGQDPDRGRLRNPSEGPMVPFEQAAVKEVPGDFTGNLGPCRIDGDPVDPPWRHDSCSGHPDEVLDPDLHRRGLKAPWGGSSCSISGTNPVGVTPSQSAWSGLHDSWGSGPDVPSTRWSFFAEDAGFEKRKRVSDKAPAIISLRVRMRYTGIGWNDPLVAWQGGFMFPR